MVKYVRVSYSLRCQIEAFLKTEISISEIANLLSLHKTTIYREIYRNKVGDKYSAVTAQVMANEEYKRCRRKKLIKADIGIKIQEKLVSGWSPEQIAGRFKKEKVSKISHQTVYRYIEEHKSLRIFLRRFNKRGGGRLAQRKGESVNSRLRIEDRPAVANDRKRLGDWERDLFYAGNRKQILVCTDRKSRLTKLAKLERATGINVQKETIRLLKIAGGKSFTVTNDNGSEFKQDLPLGIPVYFCKPLKPNQRGTVENTIGLLRQYISRTTDIEKYDLKTIEEIENLINFRPRKILDYKTPYEVYYKEKVALAMAN